MREEDLGEPALEFLVRPFERFLAGLELALVASDLVVRDLEFDEELLLLLAPLLGDQEIPDHLRPARADQLDVCGLLLRQDALDLLVLREVHDEVQTRHLVELGDVRSREDAEVLGKPDGRRPTVGVGHGHHGDVLDLVEQAEDRRGAQAGPDDGDVQFPGAKPSGNAILCRVGHL